MIINSIKDISIPELGRRNENSASLSADKGMYNNDIILSEVLTITQMIMPGLQSTLDFTKDKFYPVNVFGYYYTHGLLFENHKDFESSLNIARRKYFDEFRSQLNEDVQQSEARDLYLDRGEFYSNELKIHYDILKPMQDERVDKIKQRYLQKDIIASLRAFDIDIEKFWYVLLWMRHYIDSKLINQYDSFRPALDCLEELCEAIKTENSIYNSGLEALLFDGECKMKYNLNLETHDRYGKNAINIDNPLVLMTIKNLIEKYLKEVVDNTEEPPYYPDFQPTKRDMIEHNLCNAAGKEQYFYNSRKKARDISVNAKKYWWRKYLLIYLRDLEGATGKCIGDFINDFDNSEIAKGVPSYGVRVDKEWLITRLYYIVYDLPEQKNKLKADLSNINIDNVYGYSYIYDSSR